MKFSDHAPIISNNAPLSTNNAVTSNMAAAL